MFAAEIRLLPGHDVSPAAGDARRDARSSVVVPGRINDVGARSLCRVADLSISGARLLTHASLSVGRSVLITLPGQKPRRATVVWAEDHVAGCAFAAPLAQELLDLLVAIYRFTPAEPEALLRRH